MLLQPLLLVWLSVLNVCTSFQPLKPFLLRHDRHHGGTATTSTSTTKLPKVPVVTVLPLRLRGVSCCSQDDKDADADKTNRRRNKLVCLYASPRGTDDPNDITSNTASVSATSTETNTAQNNDRLSPQQEQEIQWDLFTQHQARGRWRGTWTFYDYMGDVVDETMASVNLILDPDSQTVQHTHDIVMGKVSSDCSTCFDSEDVKTIPIGTYSRENLNKYRCASIAMCAGPTLTKSGIMSTELVLSHNTCPRGRRVRVIYQHAPVWENGVEPGSCPPQALKLFRIMVSKEVLMGKGVPPEGEMNSSPPRGEPSFFRKVSPFGWHSKWMGSSWTWGPQTGDRGWSIEELEEADAWHGRPTGDTSDVWSLRLAEGGILLQCPRIITSGQVGLCRLAWLSLPDDDNDDVNIRNSMPKAEDGDTAKLFRVEAGVVALEPVIDEENDVMLGFYPPQLTSLRCDVLQKSGELEEEEIQQQEHKTDDDDGDNDSLRAIRNALRL